MAQCLKSRQPSAGKGKKKKKGVLCYYNNFLCVKRMNELIKDVVLCEGGTAEMETWKPNKVPAGSR